jgi:hypothetical protein
MRIVAFLGKPFKRNRRNLRLFFHSLFMAAAVFYE